MSAVEAPERTVQAGYLGPGWRVWWEAQWHTVTRAQLSPDRRWIYLTVDTPHSVTGRPRVFHVATGHFVAAEPETESDPE